MKRGAYSMQPKFTLPLAERPATSQSIRQYYFPEVATASLVVTLALTYPTHGDATRPLPLSATMQQEGTRPTLEFAARPHSPRRSSRLTTFVQRLHEQITPEQWARTPRDLSANIDRLVYGG